MAHPSGIGNPFCFARYILLRATPVFAMSSIIGGCRPAGAAIDQGLVPTVFLRPPQGAMAGLAFVDRGQAIRGNG
jgi:hypothetical protein